MNRSRLVISALFIAAGSLAVAAVLPSRAVQGMPEPTEHHKKLQSSIGNWEGTLTMFVPGAAEQKVPAKEEVTAMGPFWNQSHFSCDFMGMPFQGWGLNGFDPEKKKFVSTWVDSMNASLTVMEGENDATGNTVFRYEAKNMAGEMSPHRMVLTQGDNSYTSTFYEGAGEGTKSMVIEMKRAASRPVEAGSGK